MTTLVSRTDGLSRVESLLVREGLREADPNGLARNERSIVFRLEHEGRFAGAVVGRTLWSYLSFGALWVDPALRGQGHGTALLQAAEQAAREEGCTSAVVSTFDFQAPGLYRRLGYSEYGSLEDYPVTHRHLHFCRSILRSP